MQIQVVPKYVNQPRKQGRKYGSIKTADNAVHWVPINHLHHFQVGQAANIATTYQQWGDMQASVVTNINGVDITGQAASSTGHVPAGDRPSVSSANVPQDDPAESIFVTGIVGRAMGSGQFGITDIDILTKAAVRAWRERHRTYHQREADTNGQSLPDGREEPPMDDEIPF